MLFSISMCDDCNINFHCAIVFAADLEDRRLAVLYHPTIRTNRFAFEIIPVPA